MPIGNGIATGNAVNYIQVRFIIRAIEMYQKHGLIPSRNGTPAHMRALASVYTGKTYARSAKGLASAHDDLVVFLKDKQPDDVRIMSTPTRAAVEAWFSRHIPDNVLSMESVSVVSEMVDELFALFAASPPEERGAALCGVCCGQPLRSGRTCICAESDWPGTEQGEMQGLRKALFRAENDIARLQNKPLPNADVFGSDLPAEERGESLT